MTQKRQTKLAIIGHRSKDGHFYEGESQIPAGRDITIEFDGEKAYSQVSNDRKLTNLIQTDEFEQLFNRPATAFARISGMMRMH